MIKDKPLIFIDTVTKNYYIKHSRNCDTCKARLEGGDAFFLISEYSNNDNISNVCCVDCAKKYKKLGKITEFRQGFINKYLPTNAIPFIFSKPELKGFSGENVFTAATSKDHKGVTINDKTKLAIRDDNFIDKLIESSPKRKLLTRGKKNGK